MPKSTRFEEDEAERIDRAMLAYKLRVKPSEIDAMPARDIWDLIAVINHEAAKRNPKD